MTSDCQAARKFWVIIVRMNVYFLSISVGCFLQIKDPIRCGDMSPSPRSFYSTFRSKASCAFGYWVRLNSISVGRKSPIVTVLPFATTPLQIGHGSGGGFGEGQTCGRVATRNGAHSPTRLGMGERSPSGVAIILQIDLDVKKP